jgi:hypothetical protein
MSMAHLLYVPVCVLIGLALGYVLGARAARAEATEQARQAKE